MLRKQYMRILFDQGTPVPIRKSLTSYKVITVFELGWSTLKNGELISRAENNGFDLFITTDKNLKYQQNLTTRKIAILVLSTTSWPRIKQSIDQITEAIDNMGNQDYIEIDIKN